MLMFSKDTEQNKKLTEIYNLALDLSRNNFSRNIDGNEVTKEDLESSLRKRINDEILDGRTMYQAVRRNNILLFEMFEEIINTEISEDVLNCPFVENFCEVKDRSLGDTTSFYSEGGLLTVSSFAGNHWDTSRQSLDIGQEFTLSKEWFYIHAYDELERFLTGVSSLEKFSDKIYKSVNKYLKDRIYTMFGSVANSVPAEFSASGNSEEAVGDLCDLVAAASGSSSLTIAGTKSALRKLAAVVPDKMFANSQKEAKAATGTIGDWEGNSLFVIPQALTPGTYNLALDNDTLFIMSGDVKPIKLEFFGDTRAKIDTEGQRNNDQTVDMQFQTKMGMGMVLPPYFGKFTFA